MPAARVIILGSTGSVGTQTLDVLAHLNRAGSSRYTVVGLAAARKAKELAAQARQWGVKHLALADDAAAADLPHDLPCAFRGPGAAARLVRETEADLVVAAMVGVAGLPATLAAVELGRDVALANKETLVAAGSLVVAACRRSGAKLLPVDSEHAAAWQCLRAFAGPDYTPPAPPPANLRRLILTASGGAFRDQSRAEVYHATPEQALKHPTWSMGAKVTIDSATLTNKALELIEAHWLYGLPATALGVLIHRQSLVHAIAEGRDNALIAQLAGPDMRLAIHTAITRATFADADNAGRLDLGAIGRLEFHTPDPERFPALALADFVIEHNGSAGATMNAANEAAVEAFLAGRLPFGRIDEITRDVTLNTPVTPVHTLADVLEADRQARANVASAL